MDNEQHCETPGRPWVLGENSQDKMAVVFKPPCGMWSCPVCAENKASVWVLDAFRGATILIGEGEKLDFITVTARGGRGRTRDRSLDAFRAGWPKLRKKARYYLKRFDYILVPEQHKNGVVHFHLLATNTLSERWWKDNAYYAGLGYMSHVRPVKHQGAAASYVAKYLGKDFAHVVWPKGFRRARASKGWPRLQHDQGREGWDYAVYKNEGKLRWEIAMLEDYGYEIRVSESAGLD